jgi:beta-lactamase superfamily II metal-dependent hydrolase
MRIHAINAFEGDSLLLEAAGRFALIDAGPRGTYETHVRDYLRDAIRGAPLEAVIVSHVDIDHIAGVLDLVADIERARADGEAPPFEVKDLWHNSFAATIDDDQGNVSAGLREMATMAGRAQVALASAPIALLGIHEGAMLRRLALKLGIPINGAFGGGKLISPDELVDPTWSIGDVELRVVGPTDANLRALREKWREWIEDNIEAFAEGEVEAMANADRSVPNLSSIVFLAANADGTALLTGDARGDHIVQGLEAAGLLDGDGKLHVSVLKLQHHGSDRNVTKRFFENITADLYLVSADGKNGNPDFKTLQWIVETAHEQNREPTIVATNRTESTDRLLNDFPPAQFGYRLAIRPADRHAIVVDVASASVV